MLGDIDDFLHYFRGLNRRAVRDVGELDPAAETWRPPVGEGENGWDVGQIVAHMASGRVFFARAYVETSWHAEEWPHPTRTREQWVAALDGIPMRRRKTDFVEEATADDGSRLLVAAGSR
jgi:hypothetical protein